MTIERHRIAVLVLLSALLGGTAHAGATGRVRVKVTDADGMVLPCARVELHSRWGIRVKESDTRGVARFVGLASGVYTVRAARAGCCPAAERLLEVRADAVARVGLEIPGSVGDRPPVFRSAIGPLATTLIMTFDELRRLPLSSPVW